MPKRTIDTAMWSDRRFADLSAHAQLVFIRLVTGPETIQCGATCVHPKTVASDCNLTRAEAAQAIDELAASGLVRGYDDEWLWMPKWMEHQVHAKNFIQSARASTKGLPDALRKAAGREIDRLFGGRKPVDNSTDGPDSGNRASDSIRRSTDTSRTENVATSRQDDQPLPKGSPSLAQGFGNPLRAVSESVTETETETGSGLSFGQTDLTRGQDPASSAPSSAAAGAAAGANQVDDEEIAEVVSLAIARAHAEPVPDPSREAEREEIAREIERRRQAKLMAEASA